MKKQENLESNNFYVFLKVRRRIYFFITSQSQNKIFFGFFSLFFIFTIPSPQIIKSLFNILTVLWFDNKFFLKRHGVQSRDNLESCFIKHSEGYEKEITRISIRKLLSIWSRSKFWSFYFSLAEKGRESESWNYFDLNVYGIFKYRLQVDQQRNGERF